MRVLQRPLLLVLTTVLVLSAVTVSLGAVLGRLAPGLGLPGSVATTQQAGHKKIESAQQCSHCHLARHKAPLTGPCQDCHVTSTWRSSRTHESRAMDAGQHSALRCAQCHTDPNVVPKPTCGVCHRTVAHLWEPNCARCHTVQSWTQTPYELPKRHFAINTGHDSLRCPDCHKLLDKQKTPPPRCKECHKQHTKTFPLTAGHKKPRCAVCHSVNALRDNLNKISIKGTECAKCHKTRHEGYTDCGACHKEKFAGTKYAHSKVWPLAGTHRTLGCKKCHAEQQWKDVKGTQCVSCHAVRHSGLTDCARCHTPVRFDRPIFRHDSVFPLNGGHSVLPCSRCHPRNDLGRVRGTTCVQCHGVKHGGLTACASCHTAESFKPPTFRHSRVWAKTGVHATTACLACHPKKQYAKTKGRVCAQCHGIKHNINLRCDTCHTTYGWAPIKLTTHSSKYPLYGQHRYVECSACHTKLTFPATPNRCVDCHSALGHDGHTNCEACHVPRSWSRILPHDMRACLD